MMNNRPKLENLRKILSPLKSVLIAYSGGLDSTFLLKMAADVLGKQNVLAVTAESPSFPVWELNSAKKTALKFKIKHLTVKTAELSNPQFVNNPQDRCYWCKKELFSQFSKLAERKGLAYVADGTNLDDAKDFRPGMKAALELNIKSPLKEAEITKADIRKFSRSLKLPTWDKPSLACLASRFPYGETITEKKLLTILKAEKFLLDLGFKQVRVRHHNNIARIEISDKEFAKLLDTHLSYAVVKKFKKLGYTYITLDLQGYRTGSMNVYLAEI